MRVKQICYHLRAAAHFRALARMTERPAAAGGILLPKNAAARARTHEDRAAELFAEGLARWGKRAQTQGARDQRRRRRRNVLDPRTPAEVRGKGRGAHNRGRADWGAHAKRSKQPPCEKPRHTKTPR